MLKKIKYAFFGIILFLFGFSVWALEPFSINIFAKLPSTPIVSYIESYDTLKSNSVKAKADTLLLNAMMLNDHIAVSAGVSVDSSYSWAGVSGYKKKSNLEEADLNTRFRIASLSKPMTAVAILQLVERGELDINATIDTYLPQLTKKYYANIKLYQLLNHTSGIRHYHNEMEVVTMKQYDNLSDALNKFIDDPLVTEPGHKFLYTTYGYTVLGAIIESVTSMSYQDYMDKHIWIPAGMTSTSIENSQLDYDNEAELYIKWKQQYIKSPKTNLSVKYPGGGIQSTASDLIKFGNAILNNTLLDSVSTKLMLADSYNLRDQVPYVLGWYSYTDQDDGRIIEHGGSQSGSSSFLRIYLDKGIVTTVISNSFNANEEVNMLSGELSRLALSNDMNSYKVNLVNNVSVDVFEEFSGQYQFKDEVINVFFEGNQVFSQKDSYPPLVCYPSSKSTCFFRYIDGGLTLEGDRLIYHRRLREKVFEKVD